MRLLIVAAAFAVLISVPAYASGGTGTGKGNETVAPATVATPPAMPSNTSVPNPCKEGDTYDATKDLCTATNGKTYTPMPPPKPE